MHLKKIFSKIILILFATYCDKKIWLTILNSNSFTQKSTQLWRYIGDRAGVMAINNLPVMWLFATRNNFLLWATGWEFTTFNIFHRWIARACALEVFVHGMCVCIYQNLGESVIILDALY
jgi:hypothetical protein